MARSLRIERPNGRYHVTARGNERREIFRDETDHFHFLELISKLKERFGVEVHAYVLMDNHYHLLLQTPEANLSRAMHWLNSGYCMWFNVRHRRHGHLLQGRFGGLIVEDDAGWQEVARYIHLNPVRVTRLELDKSNRSASRVGVGCNPSPELVAERLRTLREFRWSSYPGYAGYKPPQVWVCREPLARLCGGRTLEEQAAAVREYTESVLLQGALEPPWSRARYGLILGSAAFAQAIRREARGNSREQRALRDTLTSPDWAQIVDALEQTKGERWASFAERHGDWGRDAALWLGRRVGRMRLAELGQAAGGLDYAVVSKTIARFARRLSSDDFLREQLAFIERRLSE